MIRRFLIRLYPRAWRDRYGEEFALLLESTPVTALVVANVVGASAREWLLRTLTGRAILGAVIAYASLLPVHLLLAEVEWTRLFDLIRSLIGLAVVIRALFGFRRRLSMSGGELMGWVVALFIGSMCWQWEALVGNASSDFDIWTTSGLWLVSAVDVASKLILLAVGSKRAPYRPSSRPLGLS